jgi:hypothetical protein
MIEHISRIFLLFETSCSSLQTVFNSKTIPCWLEIDEITVWARYIEYPGGLAS